MSQLSTLYITMDNLRQLGIQIDDRLEKQISELEEEIIKKEILPIVTETIAPALKEVQRELVLVVDYIPGSPISVHLSRKSNLTAEITDAKEILPDPQVEHKEIGKVGHKSRVSPTRLKIIYDDGRILEESTAVETLIKFVLDVGIERVRSLGLIQCKVPLISNTLDEKYARAQKPLGRGWYLMSNSSTQDKKRNIERIAKAFHLKLKVEII